MKEPVIIIPARYDSSRFPGKALANICGKPVIEHVYLQARKVEGVSEVIVATDDDRIGQAVSSFGGKVVMTGAKHRNGSERVAEVAQSLPADIVVNLQGDEPLISPQGIAQAIAALQADPKLEMASLMTQLHDPAEIEEEDVVKVTVDSKGYALYFSRARIPYARTDQPAPVYRHIGVYVFRRASLLRYAQMDATPLEQAESLEQLRALENGMRIKMIEIESNAPSIDSPTQLARVARLMGSE